MTLMGLVTNKEGLLGLRFVLGLAEAGLFPGVNVSKTDRMNYHCQIVVAFMRGCICSFADTIPVLSIMLVQEI